MQGTDGNIYGANEGFGSNGEGTVFQLLTGLGPFVKTNPLNGTVGTQVIIFGTGLTGTTGVSFNGTAATFSVVSSTEILAGVPAGTTTGFVTVTTPTGTLKSNLMFRID